MYDLIGDIHGQADALERLLATLGYTRRRGCHRHPGRQVIFLGDFIDRGPKIRETLAIVRPMIESGAARAVMGNHELNALAFHTPDPDTPGEYLRPRNEKNCRQHAETMRQLPADELQSTLQWFRTCRCGSTSTASARSMPAGTTRGWRGSRDRSAMRFSMPHARRAAACSSRSKRSSRARRDRSRRE